MNLSLYLNKRQNLLTSPAQLQSPSAGGSSCGAQGGSGGLLDLGRCCGDFRLHLLHDSRRWRGGEGCCLSQFIPVDISLVPKSSIRERSCLALRTAYSLADPLLSQRLRALTQMKWRVEGERGAGGALPHPAALEQHRSLPTPSPASHPQLSPASHPQLFLSLPPPILKCIWWSAVAGTPRTLWEALWCAVEDWSVNRIGFLES